MCRNNWPKNATELKNLQKYTFRKDRFEKYHVNHKTKSLTGI